MSFEKITYCALEGVPCLVTRSGGGSYIYEYKDGKWAKPSPENTAEIYSKAGTMSQADFESRFPDVGLPETPE